MENIKIWPEWKIENLIGEGSYGKVYKVRRENQGRVEYAALKVIDIPKDESEIRMLIADGMDEDSIITYYEIAAKDLFNEIKIMESLRSAPNVVTLQDARLEKKEDGIGWTIYIRMELLTSMEDYLRKKKLTVDEVMKLGTDICSAISSCEKAHIIHRDIKPQNIFVNDFGDFKLGDFGIARQLERTGSMHSMKGTSMYMAPEVVKGLGYDRTVDIYSLGIMLYRYMNHGRAPFYPPYPQQITPIDIDIATKKKNSGEQMPSPEEADEEQTRIILKACSYNPSERYQSAESLRDDLLMWQLKNKKKKEENITEAVEKTEVLVPNEQKDKKEKDTSEINNKVTKQEDIQLFPTVRQPHVEKERNRSAKTEGNNTAEKNAVTNSSSTVIDVPVVDDPEEAARRINKQAEEQKKKEEYFNSVYYSAITHMKEDRISEYEKAIELFEKIPGWKDTAEQVSICNRRIAEIKLDEVLSNENTVKVTKQPNTSKQDEAERSINSGDSPKKKDKRIIVIVPLVVLIVATLFLFIKQVNRSYLSRAKIGSHVVFGKYEQDDDASNGKEPIEWIVLAKEKDRALLISKYGLAAQQYNTEWTDETWETCSLRKWLNETFLNAPRY